MRRLESVLFSVFMSIFMSVPISFVMVAINLGFTELFFKAFITSSLIGFFVSVPIAIFSVPLVRKIVNKIMQI